MNQIKYIWADRATVESRLDEINELFGNFKGMVWTREQITCDLLGKWKTSILLEKNGRIVAFSFNSIKDNRIHIHALFVAPEFRKEGLASKIITKLKEKENQMDLSGLQLKVDSENKDAVLFYLSQGFKVVDEIYKENVGKLYVMELLHNKEKK